MMKKGFIRIFQTIFGSVAVGVGVSLFVSPNNLVPGGVTGVSILLSKLTGGSVGAIAFLLNIPIMALALWKFGLAFSLRTTAALALSSTAIDVFSLLPPLTDDPVIASLAGGGLVAIGVGVIFRAGATTGGIDVIVRLIKLRKPHLKTGNVFLITDGLIAIASGFVLKNPENVVYSLLTIAVAAAVMNFVLYGADEARLLIIICEREKEVIYALVSGLGAGVSLLEGRGGFSGKAKSVLISAVRNQNFHKAKQLISEADSRAFVIVSSASAIYGEGFKDIKIDEI